MTAQTGNPASAALSARRNPNAGEAIRLFAMFVIGAICAKAIVNAAFNWLLGWQVEEDITAWLLVAFAGGGSAWLGVILVWDINRLVRQYNRTWPKEDQSEPPPGMSRVQRPSAEVRTFLFQVGVRHLILCGLAFLVSQMIVFRTIERNLPVRRHTYPAIGNKANDVSVVPCWDANCIGAPSLQSVAATSAVSAPIRRGPGRPPVPQNRCDFSCAVLLGPGILRRRNPFRYLSLRVYQRNLLSASAGWWLSLARVFVVAVALVDGTAWGNLAFNAAPGVWAWVAAAAVFVFVFIIVSSLDVSILTSDSLHDEHARTVLREAVKTTSKKPAFGFRLLIIIGTLIVTSPFLAMLILHKDIEHNRYVTIERQYDQKIKAKDLEIHNKREELEAEVAGHGKYNHIPKCGPVCTAIKANITALEVQRTEILQQKQMALVRVSQSTGSILESWHALDEFKNDPEHSKDYWATELTVQAFLILVYCSLLAFKIFESGDVKLYFSAILQNRYLRHQESTPNITGQEFYEFVTDATNIAPEIAALQERCNARRDAVDTLQEAHNAAVGRSDEAREYAKAAAGAEAQGKEKRNATNKKLADLERDSSAFDVESSERLKCHYKKELERLDSGLRSLENARVASEREAQRAATRMQQAEDVLREARAELKKHQELLSDLNDRLRQKIFARAVAGLNTPSPARLYPAATSSSGGLGLMLLRSLATPFTFQFRWLKVGMVLLFVFGLLTLLFYASQHPVGAAAWRK